MHFTSPVTCGHTLFPRAGKATAARQLDVLDGLKGVLNPGKHKLDQLRQLKAAREAAQAAAADDATPPATRQQLQEKARAAEEEYSAARREVSNASTTRRSIASA